MAELEAEVIQKPEPQTEPKTRGPKPGYKRFRPEPKCKTCQYSRTHRKFHEDLLNSTYFDPNGVEGITQIIKRWKVHKSLGYRNVMNHVSRHLAPIKQHNDELEAQGVELVDQPTPIPANLRIEEDADSYHERVLDKAIAKFEEALQDGKVKLTASTGLQAIKIKADIETRNKDRKLDFMKAFSAMGQKSGEKRDTD